MPDREKVVTALECLADGQTCACCDYQPYDDCAKRVARDALALLKEQEPVEAVDDPDDPLLAFCGECGHTLGFREIFKYCPHCGKEVKWND